MFTQDNLRIEKNQEKSMAASMLYQ